MLWKMVCLSVCPSVRATWCFMHSVIIWISPLVLPWDELLGDAAHKAQRNARKGTHLSASDFFSVFTIWRIRNRLHGIFADNEQQETNTRFGLCLFLSFTRGQRNRHLCECYSLKPPLNLDRRVQYWCGWKCEATRDELQPAVGLLWYYHGGTTCTRRIWMTHGGAEARRRFICGDEMWILQQDNVQLKRRGVRPKRWYNSHCTEPYIILSFLSLSTKGGDVGLTLPPHIVYSNNSSATFMFCCLIWWHM